MSTIKLKYRIWEFEVDKTLTEKTYENISGGGADTCGCYDCKNYVAYRENIFPDEVLQFFNKLGVDYRKDAEVVAYCRNNQNELHQVGGWFHFKGQIISGPHCDEAWKKGIYNYEMTAITDNFEIGFFNCDHLTFFEDKSNLVQIEFMTNIPWVIDKSIETE